MKKVIGLALAIILMSSLLVGCAEDFDKADECRWSAWSCSEEASASKKTRFQSYCIDCKKERTYSAKPSKGLEYEENEDGTLTVTGLGSCKDKFLYIGGEYNNKKVTGIADRAFDGETGIMYLYVSGDVRDIAPHAFIACSELRSATLGSGVSSLGMYAFFECVSMHDIAIPESVTVIEDYTLAGCYSLKEINLHGDITFIGKGAFAGCKSIKSFSLPKKVKELSEHMLDACLALETVDISSAGGVLPESIFAACESLRSVEIPDTIHTIDTKAFIGCKSLESVYIPLSVKTIVTRDGESPFYMCNSEILTVRCEAGAAGSGWGEGYGICNYIEYEDSEKPAEPVWLNFLFGQKR